MGIMVISFVEEDDLIGLVRDHAFDIVVADETMEPMLPFFRGRFVSAPHFAVSGICCAAALVFQLLDIQVNADMSVNLPIMSSPKSKFYAGLTNFCTS